jgi:hypothetical protein
MSERISPTVRLDIAGAAPAATGAVTDDLIIMSVARAASGGWQVEGDDGSICENGFTSRGAAQRWLDDRSEPDDRQVRSMVERCSPAQRRELRRLLDDLDGGDDAGVGGYGPT